MRKAACLRTPPPPAWFSRSRNNKSGNVSQRPPLIPRQPARRRMNMPVVSAEIEPFTFVFEDDGLVPNSPMPFLVYKEAVDVDNAHPEQTIEELFGANGWGDMWRN